MNGVEKASIEANASLPPSFSSRNDLSTVAPKIIMQMIMIIDTPPKIAETTFSQAN